MLQHLISDPQYGLLLPRQQALSAFQTTDHHLRKCYPHLTEGHHLVRIQGADHVNRVFFTLDGLLALADLLNTPPAQTIKATILQATQATQLPQTTPTSPGALVPTYSSQNSAVGSQNPAAPTLNAIESLPFMPTYPLTHPLPNSPTHPLPNTPTSDPRIALIAQQLQGPIVHTIHQAIRHATPPPAPAITPQQLTDIIHHTSEQTATHIQMGLSAAQTIQQSTAHTLNTAHHQSHTAHIQTQNNTVQTLTVFHHIETWLDQQDRLALALFTSGLIALLSIGTYCLVAVLTAPPQHPSTTSLSTNG